MVASKRDESRLREKPQQIADELRGMIVSGKLSEGDSLGREPELVERFGVSRPSLREAPRQWPGAAREGTGVRAADGQCPTKIEIPTTRIGAGRTVPGSAVPISGSVGSFQAVPWAFESTRRQ